MDFFVCMELIIKPTSACNFACTFCSAGKLHIKKTKRVPDQIVNVINTIKPHTIILTGGDPLCVGMEYYDHLLSLGDFHISLTTNLKSYFLNRDYWAPLLKNSRVGVATSFQYGNERLWDKNTVYSEEMFRKVMMTFYEDVGYMPSFITVITKNNYKDAIKHAELARDLGTICKINPVKAIGHSNESLPLYSMFDIWVELIKKDLWKYTDYKTQFLCGGCGFNTSHMCENCIRACWVDKDNNLKYSHCEELLSWGIQIEQDTSKPLPIPYKLQFKDILKPDCYNCELFHLCNGCRVHRIGVATTLDVDTYCCEMKKRIPIIKQYGKDWKLA